MDGISFTLNAYSSGDQLSASITAGSLSPSELAEYKSFYKLRELVQRTNINPRFRIFVLHPDETPKYQIPNEDIVLGGSYSENYQNGQRRSLSFSLINEDGKYTPNINGLWVGTKFLFEIGLELEESEGSVVWFTKGIYVLTNASPERTIESKVVNIECSDKFYMFESSQGIITDTLEVPVGTDIKTLIQDTLLMNTGTGYVFDPKPIIYHPVFEGKLTPLIISMSAGDNYGSLLTQLAEILSAEIFYNSNGNLVITPIVEVATDSNKSVIFNLVDVNGDFQSNNITFNLSEVVNKVVVIGSNVNGHTCVATAVNDDPCSPLCYQRIGYRIAAPVNDSNITSDILAQERADYELRNQLIAKTTIDTAVFFNPILSVNNLVTLSDSFYNINRERFLIQSISYSLDYSGLMNITVSNINNLPFVA